MEFVGAAVQSILMSESNVTSLTTEIYHARIPQNKIEFQLALRHYIDDTIPSSTKADDGGVDGDGAAELETYEYRVEIFSKDDFSCMKLARAVRRALDRKSHGLYTFTAGSESISVNLQGVEFEGGGEMPDLEDTPDYYFAYLVFSIRVLRTI